MEELVVQAQAVLERNDRGAWTIPAAGLYPHQWLWDSCFIAIGLRHIDPERAATELKSLLRGQWSNGMLPHIIFASQPWRPDDSRLWGSQKLAASPRQVQTSGITQPPVVAEAVARVAEMLEGETRQAFLGEMVPALIRYHEWLYRERDPVGVGLVTLLHPWETGLDNSPAWIQEMKNVHTPVWLKLTDWLHLDYILTSFRRDTKRVPADERMKTLDVLRLHHAQQDLRRHGYDLAQVLQNPHRHFVVESLSYNCILIRNNQILTELAGAIHQHIPDWLTERFAAARQALTVLCNPLTGICYHRNFDSHLLEEEPSISIFFPLYAGVITPDHALKLVNLMINPDLFWTLYPIPSVPEKSDYFSEKRYWQGPTWLNTNWMIADGLKRYGFGSEAEYIRQKSLELVTKSGYYEYFSPLDGSGHGAADFSWTAALAIDFAKTN